MNQDRDVDKLHMNECGSSLCTQQFESGRSLNLDSFEKSTNLIRLRIGIESLHGLFAGGSMRLLVG